MPNITIHHEEVPDEFMHYVGQDWRRIIDIQFNVHSSSESGDAHEFSTSVINHQTLFDFEAYKKAVTLRVCRNRVLRHTPDGTEKRTVWKVCQNNLVERLPPVGDWWHDRRSTD